MATDPRLRADLLKKLGGVTRSRLHQRVADLKLEHGPMSTEDATYVLAHIQGLDLAKYLNRETFDRIRGMVPRSGAQAAAPSPGRAAACAAGS